MERNTTLAIMGALAFLLAGTAQAQTTLTGPLGYTWDIDTQGTGVPGDWTYSGTGCIENGGIDETDMWPFLCIHDGSTPQPAACAVSDVYNAGNVAPTLDLSGRRAILASETIRGLTVHREVYVPSTGSIDFARYVDVLQNSTGSPITVSIRYGTALSGSHNNDLGSDSATVVTSSSDGDALAETTDTYFCTDDATDGGGDASLGHVMQGARRTRSVSVVGINSLAAGDPSDVGWEFAGVTVPAGGRVILVSFLVQASTRAAAQAAATPLADQSTWPAEALTGIDTTVMGSVINFSTTLSVVWYDDYEEDSTTTGIVDYLASRGHTVSYHNDGASLDLSDPAYATYDVVVAEHTCMGGTSLLNVDVWLGAGKGYVALLAWDMYESPLDDWLMTTFNVTTNGRPVGSSFGDSDAWTVTNLAWVDPTHPIATTPNSGFTPNLIQWEQNRYHVGLPTGTSIVRDSSTSAIALTADAEIIGAGTGNVAILGTNFHDMTSTDPEVRMLVENMIYWTAGGSTTVPVDADGDGHTVSGGDCDDTDPLVHPGATETCNGVDDDCDTGTADGSGETWYGAACDGPDSDMCEEGRSDCTSGARTCSDTTGDTVEACNGLDDDCNGSVPTDETDADVDTYRICAGDCDDTDAAYHPGATESCEDPEDYNCDGSVAYADVDSDGSAACVDCDDTDPDRHPGATEICDGLDDDCDGSVPTDEADDDTDTYRICDGDCDDTDEDRNPGATEICNGVDDDCDTETDEGGVCAADEEPDADVDADTDADTAADAPTDVPVDGTTDVGEDDDADGGPIDFEPSSGCGCRTAGGSAGPAGGLFLLFALGLASLAGRRRPAR